MMGDMMQDMSLDVELYNQFDMSGSWVGLKKRGMTASLLLHVSQ
jgi:hypothetical protein